MDVRDLIIHRSTELRVETGTDELVSSDLSSIFTEASDKAEAQEMAEDLVSIDLVVIIGNRLRFGIIRLIEGSPLGTGASHRVD